MNPSRYRNRSTNGSKGKLTSTTQQELKNIKDNTQQEDVVETIFKDPLREFQNEMEMKRDREYRLLNEKLREKEYRLRELEEARDQQERMSGNLAKKIEEEVMQKLTQSAPTEASTVFD